MKVQFRLCLALKASIRLALFAGAFFGAIFSSLAADSVRDLSSMADYARWIQPWSEHTNTSSQLGAGLKAIITVVNGEKPMSVVTNLPPVERLKLAYELKTTGTEIATNAACWSYFAANSGTRETPVRQLSMDAFKQLNELLAQLPDDDLSLPPPGQRVVVQVWEQDHWRIRVYDRATASPEIRSILALINNPFEQTF